MGATMKDRESDRTGTGNDFFLFKWGKCPGEKPDQN